MSGSMLLALALCGVFSQEVVLLRPGGSVAVRCARDDPARIGIVVAAGTRFTVDATSLDFDVELALVSPAGERFFDDDGLAGLDARLVVDSSEAGTYELEVVSGDGAGGVCNVDVREGRPPEWNERDRARADRAWFEEAVRRAERSGARARLPRLFSGLGEACLKLGAYPDALSAFEDALSSAGDADPARRWVARGGRGLALCYLRRYGDAIPDLVAAVDGAGEAGAVAAQARYAGHLGGAYMYSGRLEEAAAALEFAENLALEAGDLARAAHWVHQAGRARFVQGRLDLAEPLLTRALSRMEQASESRHRGAVLEMLARIAENDGRYKEAADRLREALALARERGDGIQEARIAAALAASLLTAGRTEEARDALEEARRALARENAGW